MAELTQDPTPASSEPRLAETETKLATEPASTKEETEKTPAEGTVCLFD
jgi:hypothetical protein